MDGHRIAAWDRLHDAIGRLPGWTVGPPQRNPLNGRWIVVAVQTSVRGRGVPRPALEGTGATEAEAVARLAELLETRISRGVSGPRHHRRTPATRPPLRSRTAAQTGVRPAEDGAPGDNRARIERVTTHVPIARHVTQVHRLRVLD